MASTRTTVVLLLLSLWLVHFTCVNALTNPIEEEDDESKGQAVRDWLLNKSFFSKWLPPKGSHFDQRHVVLTDIIGEEPEVASPENGTLIPVIIIPSLIGNRLYAAYTMPSRPHWYCVKDEGLHLVYVPSTLNLIPPLVNCWFYDMSLNYANGTYSEPDGIDFEIEDYGNITSVSYLDQNGKVGLWNATIAALVKNGYQEGINLRAAPYDWRDGPTSYDFQFDKLKALFEETYELNNNTPSAAISLSMGSPYFLLFLNRMSQDWKDKYIHSFFSLSGVFAGSSFAISALASREPGIPSYFPWQGFRSLIRTYGSVAWLLPFTQRFGSDMVWASLGSKNYTSADWYQLLVDAGANESAQIYAELEQYRNIFMPPNVTTYCVVGYNVSTMATIHWAANQTFDDEFTQTNGDGDGVVLAESLDCSEWASQQDKPVVTYRFNGLIHGTPTTNQQVIQLFLKSLGIDYSPSQE